MVALGAAVGAPLRWLVGRRLDSADRPLGTLTVNVVGSFVLGLLAGLAIDGDALALLGTGFCGGLTTYSTFAVQSHGLLRRAPLQGAVYVLATVGLGLAACWAGFVLGA